MKIQSMEKYNSFFILVLSSLQSPFLLAVRLYWGWQFAQTGWGKLTNIGKVVNFFYRSRHTCACIERVLCVGSRVCGRPSSPAGARLAAHRPAACDRHDRRVSPGRQRGVVLDYLESRQVHWRRAVHISGSFSAGSDLRSRKTVDRYAVDGAGQGNERINQQANAGSAIRRIADVRSTNWTVTGPHSDDRRPPEFDPGENSPAVMSNFLGENRTMKSAASGYRVLWSEPAHGRS